MNGKFFKNTLFLVVFLSVSLYYNYHEIITYRPVSVHQWRNCVSASFALNYYHEGDFFHPRTHNLQADERTSDVAVAEFPVIYYIIGILYRVFGFHEFIYKLVQILIGFTGLYFLFRLGIRILENTVLALIMPLIIFTSPVYVYYLNNFIPDAVSLSIVFIAFYYFYRYYEEGGLRFFNTSIIFLCLAGLIKTPSLLLFFAILGVFILERVFKTKFNNAKLLFQRPVIHTISFLTILLLISAWYTYAKIYTDIHGGGVSAVEIRPIWILGKSTVELTWETIKERFWTGNYHSPILMIICVMLMIHNVFFWKQYDRVLSTIVILTFSGGICFSVLFFRSLKDHDYYQINNLLVLVLIILNFLMYLKKNHHFIYRNWIFKTCSVMFVIFLAYKCNMYLSEKYYDGWFLWHSTTKYNNKYGDITPYLRSLGIKRDDPVYCTYDGSINISLYLMDQKGYTDYAMKSYPFQYKLDLFKSRGMKYVIVGDYSYIKVRPEDVGLKKIGQYNKVGIFKYD